MEWSTPEHLEPTPHMGPKHWSMIMRRVQRLMHGCSEGLEWGSGGGTLAMGYAIAWKDVEWVAVEHQQDWYRAVWSEIRHMRNPPHLLFASNPERYCYPPIPNHSRHTILVDGKFRDECLIATQEYLAPGGKVFLHDAERGYKIPEFLKEVHRSTDPGWAANPNCEMAVYRLELP